MIAPAKSAAPIRFGTFEVDVLAGELRKSDRKLRIQEQPFRLLLLLVERPGEIISREYIVQRLWPDGTFVDYEHSINTAIRKLREALGDDPDSPRFVETVPRRGYRFVAPLNNAAADHHAVPVRIEREKREKWVLAAALLFVVLVGIFVYFARSPLNLPEVHSVVLPGAELEAVPLTVFPGQEISPNFSPDGSEVAFGWDGENNGAGFDLYIKVIGTDKPLRLTNHPVPWLGVAWSPDGRFLAVHRMDKENGGIFLVPALGGPERKVVVTDDIFPEGASISWSPDGKQLAFVAHRVSTHVNSAQIFLLSLDTLERTPMETGCDYSYGPAFSPDGNTLAYACTQDAVRIFLCTRDMRTGKNTRLLGGLEDINGITWSHDGTRIIFSRSASAFIVSTGGDLWQVTPGKNGPPQKIPVTNDAASPAVSSSGNRLAYAKSRIIANVWSVDLASSQAHAHILAPSTRQQYDPVISPDGKRIAFMSDRSGGQQIWVCDIDGANPQQLTSFDQIVNQVGTPHWSPDSKQIAFDSRVSGEPNVYIVDSDGGVPRKLETGTRMNSLPSWSHDGKWIYFANGPTDSSLTIWRVAVAGGHATQLTKTQSSMPVESPDGQYVYFVRTTADKVRLWCIRPDGTDEKMVEAIPPLRTNGYEWWPFGTGIYFYAYLNGKPEVDFLDLRTSRIHRTYTPDKPPAPWLGGLSVSPDGKLLVYSRIDEVSSDLMLVDNFR